MMQQHKKPEQIEDEIRHTHDRIDQRIEQLQSSFSPVRLIERMVPGLGEAGANSGHKLVQVAKDNPLPTALIGAGLVWLLGGAAAQRNRQYGTEDFQAATTHAHGNGSGVQGPDDRNAAQRVGEHVADIRDSVAEKIDSAQSSVASKAQSAGAHAKDMASDAADATTAAARQTGETLKSVPSHAQDLSRRGMRWTKENPIPTALMCVAAGAALASFFTVGRNESSANGNGAADTYDQIDPEEGAERADALHKGADKMPKAAKDTQSANAKKPRKKPSSAKASRPRAAKGDPKGDQNARKKTSHTATDSGGTTRDGAVIVGAGPASAAGAEKASGKSAS